MRDVTLATDNYCALPFSVDSSRARIQKVEGRPECVRKENAAPRYSDQWDRWRSPTGRQTGRQARGKRQAADHESRVGELPSQTGG